MDKKKIRYWRSVHKYYKDKLGEMYKERKDDYLVVYIFETLEEMYRYGRKQNKKIGLKESKEDYAARTYKDIREWLDEEGNVVGMVKCHGSIIFCKEDISYSYLAHESAHATMDYMGYHFKKDIGDLVNDGSENFVLYNEIMAYMIGGITGDIIRFVASLE